MIIVRIYDGPETEKGKEVRIPVGTLERGVLRAFLDRLDANDKDHPS